MRRRQSLKHMPCHGERKLVLSHEHLPSSVLLEERFFFVGMGRTTASMSGLTARAISIILTARHASGTAITNIRARATCA